MAEEPVEETPLVTAANQYFQIHLESTKWSVLTNDQKLAALTTAQGEISCLPLRSVMPVAIKNEMVYEQALFLSIITGDRQNLQAQGVQQAAISGGASETYRKLTFGIALAPRAKLKATGYWALGVVR